MVVNGSREVGGEDREIAIQRLFESREAIVDQNIRVEVEGSVEAMSIAKIPEYKRLDRSIQFEDVVPEGKALEARNLEVFCCDDLEWDIPVIDALGPSIDQTGEDLCPRMVSEVRFRKHPRHAQVIVGLNRESVDLHIPWVLGPACPLASAEDSRLRCRDVAETVGAWENRLSSV